MSTIDYLDFTGVSLAMQDAIMEFYKTSLGKHASDLRLGSIGKPADINFKPVDLNNKLYTVDFEIGKCRFHFYICNFGNPYESPTAIRRGYVFSERSDTVPNLRYTTEMGCDVTTKLFAEKTNHVFQLIENSK